MARTLAIVVSSLWGISCAQLVVQGWLASADLVIAIVAFVRGRAARSRTFGAVIAALITGVICSLLLRVGFWLLVEVMAFGRTGPEKIAYVVCLGLSLFLMLRRLPSKVRTSWQAAMSPD